MQYAPNGTRRDRDNSEIILPDVGRARTVATAARPLGGIRALRKIYEHMEVACEESSDVADCWDAD